MGESSGVGTRSCSAEFYQKSTAVKIGGAVAVTSATPLAKNTIRIEYIR